MTLPVDHLSLRLGPAGLVVAMIHVYRPPVRRVGPTVRSIVSAQGLTPQGLSGEAPPNRASLRNRVREWLGLERNIVLVSGTMLLLGLGENLWKRYVPKYLEGSGRPRGGDWRVWQRRGPPGWPLPVSGWLGRGPLRPAHGSPALRLAGAPAVSFFAACAIGLVGTGVFMATVDEEGAG